VAPPLVVFADAAGRGGGWCARLGQVYDLWIAVIFSPLPRTRWKQPPRVTATGW
jgi:hypothetical protein